ncbi:MAG: response regulator [Gemmatimonadales bacterium]|nr:response regulator [Gemmatimonadales bacterium]
MTASAHRTRPPVVLIIDDQEWTTRSLESILAPSGFAVMRAYTAKKGLDRVHAHAPDAIFIDLTLPDESGLEVCRSLRDDPQVGQATPVFITTPERPTRSQRLDAFRAGAWDVLGYPIDAEELVLRLDAYVQAKFAADRLGEDGLIDPLTGLYNLRGLERRAEELCSWAYRERQPLACVVFAPRASDSDDERAATHLVNDVTAAFRSSGRISDVIGRLGKTEIAVLAPSTGAEGATRLAARLAEAIGAAGPVPGGIDLRAGYDAVSNVREHPSEARDLLTRATLALRKSRTNGNGWLQRFEG